MTMTGKKIGLKVGDFVHTGAFPAIIISDVGTFAPCCEVFGLEQKCGSAYATDMVKLDKDMFLAQCESLGHKPPFRVWSKKSLEALKAAGIEAVEA